MLRRITMWLQARSGTGGTGGSSSSARPLHPAAVCQRSNTHFDAELKKRMPGKLWSGKTSEDLIRELRAGQSHRSGEPYRARADKSTGHHRYDPRPVLPVK